MEGDLWGPPSDLVVQDDSCYMQSGWDCDFYFDYGLDVIEENALNERSCVQVLRILIEKADAEIDELERHMVLLRNELAWAEYEDWPHICCNFLREKNDGHEKVLKNLRKENVEDSEIQLLICRGAVERLDEILIPILKSFCQGKDKLEQTHDVTVMDLHINSAQFATENMDKNSKKSNLNDVGNTENRVPSLANAGQDTSLKVQKKLTRDPESSAGVSNVSNSDASKDQTNSNNVEKFADSESINKRAEVGDFCSLYTAGNRKQADDVQHFKIQQRRKSLPKHSTANVDRNAITNLNEFQNLGKSNSGYSALTKFRECHSNASDKSVSAAVQRPEEFGSPDMKQRLAKAKQILKEKDSAPAEKMDSSNSFLKEEKAKISPQIFSFQEFLTATERSAVKSLLDMCGAQAKDKERPESTDEDQKSQCQEVCTVESTDANDELIFNLFSEPTGKESESCIESDPENIQNPGSVWTEKQQKKSSNDKASLNKSWNGNIKKKIPQNGQFKAGELGFELDESEKPLKKRKKNPVPLVKEVDCLTSQIQSPSQQGDSAGSLTANDIQMTVASDLKDMKLKDLRTMAKGQKLIHYYKLKKDDLVERLTNQLSPS